VKRAVRALQSDAYAKAQKKDALLPAVSNRDDALKALQLLPLSMLALRVDKTDPHKGHNHAKPTKKDPKRVKGQWDVEVVHQQMFEDNMYYMWVYEGSNWKTKMYAALLLTGLIAVVMFPLWPLMMRQGVWYVSMAAMGLLIAFFALGIVRLILFLLTVLPLPPGLWIFPNLFEDVGVIESFKPLYAWGDELKEQEKLKKKNRKKARAEKAAAGDKGTDAGTAPPTSTESAAPTTNGTAPATNGATPTPNGTATKTAVSSGAQATPAPSGTVARRQATVEEVEDE
jgi:translocation protein SEC62